MKNCQNEDQRIRNYFLIRSPASVLMIVSFYLIFVKVLGPRLMKDRKPFDLSKVLLIYNTFQVAFNAIIFYKFSNVWINDYNWRCEPLHRGTNPREMMILNASYLFFLSKIPELLDTVFFVMRKKSNQATMLHIIHHAAMPFITGFGAKFFPGGDKITLKNH